MSSMEAKLIYQKYDEMMELLRSYRERIYQQWVAGVDRDCHFNLGQPLIQRDPVSNLIRVNFSKAVGAVCFLTGQAHAAEAHPLLPTAQVCGVDIYVTFTLKLYY